MSRWINMVKFCLTSFHSFREIDCLKKWEHFLKHFLNPALNNSRKRETIYFLLSQNLHSTPFPKCRLFYKPPPYVPWKLYLSPNIRLNFFLCKAQRHEGHIGCRRYSSIYSLPSYEMGWVVIFTHWILGLVRSRNILDPLKQKQKFF